MGLCEEEGGAKIPCVLTTEFILVASEPGSLADRQGWSLTMAPTSTIRGFYPSPLNILPRLVTACVWGLECKQILPWVFVEIVRGTGRRYLTEVPMLPGELHLHGQHLAPVLLLADHLSVQSLLNTSPPEALQLQGMLGQLPDDFCRAFLFSLWPMFTQCRKHTRPLKCTGFSPGFQHGRQSLKAL